MMLEVFVLSKKVFNITDITTDELHNSRVFSLNLALQFRFCQVSASSTDYEPLSAHSRV